MKTAAAVGALAVALVVAVVLVSTAGTGLTVLAVLLLASAGAVVAVVVGAERAAAAALTTAVTSAHLGSRMVTMVEERLPGTTRMSTPTTLTKADLEQRLTAAATDLRGQWKVGGIRGFLMRKTLGFAQGKVMDQFAALPDGPLSAADVLHQIAGRIDAVITAGVVAAARQATLLWVGALVVLGVLLALLLR